MSKGLEALKELKTSCRLFMQETPYKNQKQRFLIIEKELIEGEKNKKALEIIKELDKTSLMHFLAVCVKDQEKYNLLKEVLTNESKEN